MISQCSRHRQKHYIKRKLRYQISHTYFGINIHGQYNGISPSDDAGWFLNNTMLHSRQLEIARLPENGKYISQKIT